MKVHPPGSGADRTNNLHAAELFTDRESEAQAFKAALAHFRRRVDQDGESGLARYNALVFYGMGGIGKTVLSRRFETWIKYELPLDSGWGPPPPTKVQAAARIDLHGSAGQMDLVAALISLRAGVGTLRRRWPVFDLAFASYWSAVRPGEALPALDGGDQLTDAVVETVGELLNDIGAVADVIGVGAGTGLAARGVRKLIGELRRRHDIRLGLDAFDGFEHFLMRCGDEPSPLDPNPTLACEIAGVLSWELSTLTPCPLVTVFVDATERLSLDPRRVSEKHLNALIHQMPNVLFILTGRDRLDWYEETRVDLPYRGRSAWPNLARRASEEPLQHLLRNLSPRDARTVVLRARRQLDLPMSEHVVDALVTASAGLPEYLELARQVAITVKDAGDGRQVRVEDVTGSLGSLVQRVLYDVPADEQRAMRGACLFRTFDTVLIAAAANVDEGCAQRAVLRPMIDSQEGQRFPYRMHDAVREAIRYANHDVPGGWSEHDWQVAASRASEAAHLLHDTAKERGDNREVLDAIGVAITLVCGQETVLGQSSNGAYQDWLCHAIVYGPSFMGLRSRIPAVSRTEYGQRVLDFIRAKSIETRAEERLRLLRSIFDSDHALRMPAGRHLGYALKALHRWEDALQVFEELVSVAPTPLNRRQIPITLSAARRFVEARDAAEELPDARAYVARVAEYAHGRPERYFAEVQAKLDRLRSVGREREYLEDQGNLLVRRAFYRGDLDFREIEAYREQTELAGHISGTRDALLALVLHHRSEAATLSLALDRLKMLDQAASPMGGIGFRYALAEFCDAQLAGDRGRLRALRDEAGRAGYRQRSWIPIEFYLESVGLPLPRVPTQWLEPYEVISKRWTKHLDDYLGRTRL